MTELKDDLDRALRSVTFGSAPVERAMRDGQRLRNRRRLTVLAAAVAIVSVAAGYPALSRDAATPSPVTSHTATPSPSPTTSVSHDLVITSRMPTDVANSGVVARGTIGDAQWSVAISTGYTVGDQACWTAFAGLPGTRLAATAGQVTSMCAPNLQELVSVTGQPNPASISAATGNASGSASMYAAALGAVASDVTYLVLDFTDGQQLKLIPVTYQGNRYVAWLAPASMTVARLTAHLGSAHVDSGQTATAVPFENGGDPVFGLWLKPGQAVPPTASGVIGGGTHNGHVWAETAYEGPWGTCFTYIPGDLECMPLARLGTTKVLGGWGGTSAQPVFGSVAPGAHEVFVALSDGTVVGVTPIAIGNERLFAFWAGQGVSPTGWTAYDANGHKIGHGTVPR
jgi:hypothetical protein